MGAQPCDLEGGFQCTNVVFGIDVVEEDSIVHNYVLVITLGITYDGMMHVIQGIRKTGLVVSVLCIIFTEGNCINEEIFWGVFNKLCFYAGRDHFLFGELRKLFTEDFV